MEILCVSNGHGEDQIAARICIELAKLGVSAIALPLVGVGHVYRSTNIPIVEGATQAMPSGGFVRMDGGQLWRDLRSGLAGLTWKQLQIVWQWSKRNNFKKTGEKKIVLAVGDIVPMLFAWLPAMFGGCDFVMIATAKSEYYWCDRKGRIPIIPKPWGGSVFYPWERSLICSRHCQATFVRDQFTANLLGNQFRLPVKFMGNPMMDGLEAKGLELGVSEDEWSISILPGSRPPEAYENWQSLLIGAHSIARAMSQSVTFLAAIASELDIEQLAQILIQNGWIEVDDLTYKLQRSRLRLVMHGFGDCLQQCHLGLAMAGTATEQLVGLGKPAITIVGNGPQFNRQFAEEQARLLGVSVTLVEKPAQVGEVIADLLNDPDYFQDSIENGLERMGTPGASQRIAQYLVEQVLRSPNH